MIEKANNLDGGEALSALDATSGDDHWDKILDISGIVQTQYRKIIFAQA